MLWLDAHVQQIEALVLTTQSLNEKLNEAGFQGKEPALDLSTAPKKKPLSAATIGASPTRHILAGIC